MAVPIAAAPAPPVTRPRVLVVATGFVTAACTMYFLGLIGMYLSLRSAAISGREAWFPEAAKVPLTQPNVMMFTLLLSVVTVQWAVSAIKHDDRVNTYLALGVTLLLGFAYVNMAAYLYTVMGFDLSSTSKSAVLVYAITASHLVMVLGAMAFVVLMAFRALGGQFTSRQHDGISAAALFWHASVLVFFVIYLVIYITK